MTCKEWDVPWYRPVEIEEPWNLSFPPHTLGLRQLFNDEIWAHFLGPRWREECLVDSAEEEEP